MQWSEEVYYWCQQQQQQPQHVLPSVSTSHWLKCQEDQSLTYGLPTFMHFYKCAYPSDSLSQSSKLSMENSRTVYKTQWSMTFRWAEDIVHGLHHLIQSEDRHCHGNGWHYIYFKWNNYYYFTVWYHNVHHTVPKRILTTFATVYEYLYQIRNELLKIHIVTDVALVIMSYIDIHNFLPNLYIHDKTIDKYQAA